MRCIATSEMAVAAAAVWMGGWLVSALVPFRQKQDLGAYNKYRSFLHLNEIENRELPQQ